MRHMSRGLWVVALATTSGRRENSARAIVRLARMCARY